MTLAWLGLVLAGLLNGSFAVPMKTAKRWSFHHIWGMFTFIAMVVIPWAWVWTTVPQWRALLGAMPTAGLLSLVGLGLVWGVASLLYGIALDMLGVAIGMAVQLGLSIVVGAVLPRLGAPAGTAGALQPLFWAGLAAMVGGVAVCAWAGRSPASEATRDAARFRRGLLIALLGGVFGPLLNVGISRGLGVLAAAGVSDPSAKWIVWAVFLTSASASQSSYCFYRAAEANGLARYRCEGAGPEWIRVIVMGLVWSASIGFYGASAQALGPLGPSVGWPVFIGLIVLTSNAWGVAIGEWKNKPRGRLVEMLAGSAVLVIAGFLIVRG